MKPGDPFRIHLSPLLSSLALVSSLLLACGDPARLPDEGTGGEEPEPEKVAEPVDPCREDSTPWSYEGELGPERWAELGTCFEACGDTSGQSPIDIRNPSSQKLSQIRFGYQPAPLRITNTGRSIELSSDGKSRIEFAEVSYALETLSLHAPAEHAIRGRHAPMELQLVHRSSEGQLAVVAVMLEIGEESSALTEIWERFPPTPGGISEPEGATLRTAALLPSTTTSYRYTGSETRPPCARDVQWVVLTRPLTITQEQLDSFQALFSNNSRPLQDLGERQVLTDLGGSSH